MLTNQNKVYSLLGFAAKAGKLVVGTDAVIECIQYKKAKLIIVASDASDKTKKNIQFICDKNGLKCYIYGLKDEMSHAIGKVNKVVLAVKDKNIANGIKKIINGGEAID